MSSFFLILVIADFVFDSLDLPLSSAEYLKVAMLLIIVCSGVDVMELDT